MDGWMDGWTDGRVDESMDGVDLIICKAILAIQKSRASLTCDDARALCMASPNRLRSRPRVFASRIDFGEILGRLGKPKWTPKSFFWTSFCQ